MNSKSKLAIGVILSPLVVFKEIIERRLLVDAAWIVALAGTLAMLNSVIRSFALGTDQLFAIGRDNPLTWLGLWMLFSLGVWVLLKWLGAQLDYSTVLIVLGWSQILLAIQQAVGLVWGIMVALGATPQMAASFFGAAGSALPIVYVVSIGRGVQATGCSTFFKGMLCYLIILVAAASISDVVYVQRMMRPYFEAPAGLGISALRMAPEISPVAFVSTWALDPWTRGIAQIHRLVAGWIGLALGIWWLAKFEVWDNRYRNRLVAAAVIVGVLLTGAYAFLWHRSGYQAQLVKGQRLYARGEYAQSAQVMANFSNRLTNNPYLPWGFLNKATLLSSAGQIAYEASQPDQAIGYYQRLIQVTDHANLGKAGDQVLAQAHSGIGAAYDIQGRYNQALDEFNKAAGFAPAFTEPWVRMSVTYDRMGDYPKAIQAGNKAVKELNSQSSVVWVALAEAFANTGDATQAKASMDNLAGRNPELAKKVGTNPADWRNAVAKLGVQDLKFPLEPEPEAQKK